MRRILSVGIVCCWIALVAALVQRTRSPAPLTNVTTDAPPPTAGEDWMGVYQRDQKVGYTHHSLFPDGDGFGFSDETLLRLTLMDVPQTVRTRMHGRLGADYRLRHVDFELSSGAANLRAHGVVDGGVLKLTLEAGRDTSEQVLPLTEPVYLPSSLRASLRGEALQPGKQVEALVFDPTTLKNDRMRVSIGNREPVPYTEGSLEGWRIEEEFHALKTTAWIDAAGKILREEGPLGLVLVSQSAEQAVHRDWTAHAALDVMATTAVPVTRSIDDARHRMALRFRLSGIDTERVPSDDEQVRDGSTVTITRPAVAVLGSYVLPYGGADLAAELAPSAFLQSTHPRVQAAARAAIGSERDAKRAAALLNDWVFEHVRKVPTVSLPNALQVLEMGAGDCNEHAVLFAALARAVGLPARVIAGAVYLDGAFFYHAWCEVWLTRWVPVDPTFHQFPADATHIKFVVGGPEEHVAMMEVVGRLAVEVLDETP
jgi:hypothetical protein